MNREEEINRNEMNQDENRAEEINRDEVMNRDEINTDKRGFVQR